jgi:hypothetical protein
MQNDKVERDVIDPQTEPTVDAIKSGESKLRGVALNGSERKRAVDNAAYEQARNPDDVVRVDNEEDTLYTDGLELENDLPVLGNTRRNDNMR